MRFVAILQFVLFVLLAESLAKSAPPVWLQDLGGGSPPPISGDGMPPYGVASRDLPPAANAIVQRLKAGKPRNARLDQYAWFRHEGQIAYLAIVWDLRDTTEGPFERVLEIHRVHPDDQWRISSVVALSDEHISIVEPSGSDPFDEGVGFLFVSFGSGGSSYSGYHMRVIRLGTELSEASPEGFGRTILSGDLQNDGRFAIVVSDDRWGNYFDGCGQCGPLVPVILVRNHGRYQEACSDFQGYFDARVAYNVQKIVDLDERLSVVDFLSNRTTLMLNYIQSGRISEAREQFIAMRSGSEAVLGETAARVSDEDRRRMGEERTALLERIDRDFRPVFAAVENSDRSCRLSAYSGVGGNYGLVDRLNRLRR